MPLFACARKLKDPQEIYNQAKANRKIADKLFKEFMVKFTSEHNKTVTLCKDGQYNEGRHHCGKMIDLDVQKLRLQSKLNSLVVSEKLARSNLDPIRLMETSKFHISIGKDSEKLAQELLLERDLSTLDVSFDESNINPQTETNNETTIPDSAPVPPTPDFERDAPSTQEPTQTQAS